MTENRGAPAAIDIPPQHQDRQPGIESEMRPLPDYRPRFSGAGKLKGRVAVITGGDSGIGRAIALAMAREGAGIAIVYLSEHEDAQATRAMVDAEGGDVLLLCGDVADEGFCNTIVAQTLEYFGRLDILINNAAEQHPQPSLEDVSAEQLHRTFATNLFSLFYLTRAALPHLEPGSSIINTASVTAYKGHKMLIDYASSKGAIVSFTRSLSQAIATRGVRVNAVAPGPIWTPLIPSTFDADHVARFGMDTPLGRPGQPNEVAPCYVFLACEEASYITGQVLHPNGGVITDS
jgi:NAD(P)-dependent dehydrogenase (short-subunit alcohol dehydrogenase family)